MSSYPIWVDVTACIYNSGKSYGVKNTGEQRILVGSSGKNSHLLADVIITKRKEGEFIIFRYSVDGVILKEMIFENKNGKAGKLLKTKSKLSRLKSL